MSWSPTWSMLPVSPFAALRSSTVTPYLVAITQSESPDWTTYLVPFGIGATVGLGCDAAVVFARGALVGVAGERGGADSIRVGDVEGVERVVQVVSGFPVASPIPNGLLSQINSSRQVTKSKGDMRRIARRENTRGINGGACICR